MYHASIMPPSEIVVLLLYRSFKENTSLESFRRRVLIMFLIALVPRLSSTFVSLFNYILVEIRKILSLACLLLAYGFTMVLSVRPLDRRFEAAQG
ncbi:MAG: hypothetical protein ACE5H4_11550 [Candidatus Thorarchaeota archaeon]